MSALPLPASMSEVYAAYELDPENASESGVRDHVAAEGLDSRSHGEPSSSNTTSPVNGASLIPSSHVGSSLRGSISYPATLGTSTPGRPRYSYDQLRRCSPRSSSTETSSHSPSALTLSNVRIG